MKHLRTLVKSKMRFIAGGGGYGSTMYGVALGNLNGGGGSR